MAALRARTILTVILSLGAISTCSDGAPIFNKHPPSTVRGTQGDDVLLTFVVNGTTEHDSIVIQGPNPITGSDKLEPIFERGTGEEVPHQPFRGNFTVNTAWSEGITAINLTILDVQHRDVGMYKVSVAFHAGPGINVTMNALNGSDEGATVNSTVVPLNTTESPGNTMGSRGLQGEAIAAIVVVVVVLIIAIAGAGAYLYRMRYSRTPSQDTQRYDPVNRDPHDNGVKQGAQELNTIHRAEEAEEAPLQNGDAGGVVDV